MNNKPVISLCLPTNGVSEWVFPTLDSIYSQNIENSLFEIIVTDNGNNDDFYVKMQNYLKNHENLTYKKTNAYMFENQLEALKLASGLFFKFVNHRYLFTENSLKQLIDIVNENKDNKPVIFFSNGVLDEELYELNNFDDFVRNLGRFASWTTGVGIWKDDYIKIPKDVKIDKISPHSCILFSERKKTKYLINIFKFCEELNVGHANKGSYDLFKTFGIEEFLITLNLYLDGDISAKTLKYIKEDYSYFVSQLYCDYYLEKKPCSYNLNGFNDSMDIFLNKKTVISMAKKIYIKRKVKKIIKKILLRK